MNQQPDKPIRLSAHARQQCIERGATVEEVERAIREGGREAVRQGRWMHRYNFEFNAEWQGRRYAVKQVAPIVAEEDTELVVVTVFTFYF
ncbi:MAG: DUF4258 domain-containing protein [Phycisphaeraceae bacterium]|nr:MAG: DUF4258 domain-containing protein [Phycisphaeraceae bacterium]